MRAIKDCPQPEAAVSCRPGTLAAPAAIDSNLRQESQMLTSLLAVASVFSKLRTLLPAKKLQHPYFHSLPRSLFRSFAQEQESTPVFSSACALFCKTAGDRGIPPFTFLDVSLEVLLFQCSS